MSLSSRTIIRSTKPSRAPSSPQGFGYVRGFHGNHHGRVIQLKKTDTSERANVISSGPVLQRKCKCGGSDTDCKECKEKDMVQAKLAVSNSGDRYEQEADRVATQVLSGSGTENVDNAPPQIQRVSGDHSNSSIPVTADVDRVLSTAPRPLDTSLRDYMEPRFNRDFSAVRVHSGPAATQSARELNATAYTVGQHIVFGEGQFRPTTAAGKSLIAHELTHVVQQSGLHRNHGRSDNESSRSSDFVAPSHSRTGARIQRKVVDDNEHLPCRAIAGRSAVDVSALENDAATLAEGAAAAVRATPLAESTRALVWKRFRFDYNDPLTRCRFLPEIGDRFARVADAIRNTKIKYDCVASGEPSTTCNTAVGVTHVGRFGGLKIDLCSSFWSDTPPEQALTLLHEWSHFVYSTRGLNDELPGGFDTAGCYEAFAMEVAGRPITGPQDSNCVPNPAPLPALDQGRLRLNCSANVFLNLSLFGGYARGLGGGNYGTVGVGLDFLFPLTRMHDWELGLGARYLRFAPAKSDDRAAYLLGVRAALNTRYRPWRFGSQYGAYVEGGRLSVAGEQGDTNQPYGAVGVTAGLNFHLGKQMSLQILGELGAGYSFATENKDRFKWFQTGLTAVFQFE